MPLRQDLLDGAERGRRHGSRLPFVLRVVVAGMLTAVVIGAACAGMLCTRGPEWLSLSVEPLSLLLLPGLLVGIAASGPHELDTPLILDSATLFYFGLFVAGLEAHAWRQRKRVGSGPPREQRKN